ncbi:substrate-binding domain-containing protein [Xanthomonas maliensis]|uniref:substrate-binding domain-containing protein n=1 Tax=Xanthomonas maliensis TaxID=1321368 RepID=UPI00039ACFC1|nr:substrate-binding domain-containing protein [Xanthomonas maliensis]KAB7765038.1 molybdenum ABC transporter substrate-binding protein [Xanthomonas maliensis]
MKRVLQRWLAAVVLSATLCATATAAAADHLTVMTSGGFTAAFERLAPQYAQQSGIEVETIKGPSMGTTPQAIPSRLKRGEHADVVIMVGSALQTLIDQGLVDPASRVELADSRIGMVVRHGAPKPEIATVEQFKDSLLKARSVAYSDSASGVYIETTLFKRLGIERAMTAKSTKIERIPVASKVADGSYQLGFQQVAELLPVPGADFVARIPEPLQSITRYAAGVPVNAEHPEAAKRLLHYLQSAPAQQVARETGLDAVSP